MNWDANLAAIIKHTDANLQQQFRQFDELGYDGSSRATQQAPSEAAGSNFASAFLRDTMATLRGSGATGSSASAGSATPSFAQHFRAHQDRKKRAATGSSDESDDGAPCEPQQPPRARRSRAPGNNSHGLGAHLLASPTYDVAQLMEQVRLSLKLEVDARAAIAERQLSALLQLCKASSEEIDRLRVEVCAADRQLHTLDQVQAKLRQELTTQKDIGFHLQSLCGKDESWRMQAENQLLEMRQLVAAIREQGNAVQMQVQDKLSRQELLVHFNAAIEPIKAQFQATLQHQAHQLAEISRSASSSTLLLDALTQKVNRVQADDVVMLRNELQALQRHVARMGAVRSGARGGGEEIESDPDETNGEDEGEEYSGERAPGRRPGRRTARYRARDKAVAKEAERWQQREVALKKELVDVLIPQAALPLLKSELEATIKPQLTDIRASIDRETTPLKQELLSLSRSVQENWTACQRHANASGTTIETAVKHAEQQFRSELAAQVRELRDRQDQLTAQSTAMVETRVAAIHAKHNEVVKVMDSEHKERKAANDALQEELRRVRHAWDEQLHVLACEHRTKVVALGEEWGQKLRDLDRKWLEVVETSARQSASQTEAALAKARAEINARVGSAEATTKTTVETVAKLEKAVAAQAQDTAVLAAKVKANERTDRQLDEVDQPASTLSRRASATAAAVAPAAASEPTVTQGQIASMDSLLQKMMLQMQLQMQQQQQHFLAQTTTMPPAMYAHPYAHWSATVHPNMSTQPTSVAVNPLSSSPGTNSPPQGNEPTATAEPITQHDPVGSKSTNRVTVVDDAPPPAKPVVVGGESKPSNPVALPPDPRIDEIISRAVEEELASPAKHPVTRPALSSAASKPDVSVSNSKQAPPVAVSSDTKHPSNTTSSAPPATTASTEPQVAVQVTTLSQPENVESSVDSVAKAQQTLASTVKGATTEAEMAKQRIEARRKQDQEARLLASTTTPSPHTPPLVRASSTSSLLSVVETATPSDVKPTSPTPTLPRSQSVSNLMQPKSPATKQPPLPPTSTTTAKPPPPPPPPSSSLASVARPPVVGNESKTAPSAPLSQASAPPPTADVVKSTAQKPSVAPPPPQPQPQQHQPITHVLCDQCRLPVRSDLLSEHMHRQCIKRTVGCTKCLAKFPWHEVDAHQRDCQGVVTTSVTVAMPPPPPRPAVQQPAPATSAPSPTASASSHLDTSAGDATAATQLKKCRHCASDVASTELFDHELKCDQMLKQCPHCLRRQKLSELQDHIENCDCRLVSCPNDCGGKFLQRGLDKHLTTRCPKRSASGGSASSVPASPMSAGPTTTPPPPPTPVTASRPMTAPPSSNAVPPAQTRDDTKQEKVECKFCDEEFTTREIDAHENNCDWKPRRCQHCNMVIISRDLVRHESSCKTSTKNCPHCNETMAQSALPAHTSRCSKRPIKCIRCCQLFPADSIVAHSSSCKFIPSVAASTSSVHLPSATSLQSNSGLAGATSGVSARIPPPPPYPPTSAASTPASTTTGAARSSVNAPVVPTTPATAPAGVVAGKPPQAAGDESAADRIARRNLALSQLTNQPIAAVRAQLPAGNGALINASRPASMTVAHPEVDEDDHAIDDEDEDEEDEDEDEEQDQDQLTLAQVVAEWSVENVCLWLHEDVGVPDVVPRFQQRRCNGEMLLELTESDLINDYGIKNRIHRERILSAIDAIKTSDDFSDEEEDDDDEDNEEEDEDEQDDEEEGVTHLQIPQQRASMSRLSLNDGPRDLLRRNSLPSPQQSPARIAGGPLSNASALPSSSAMLRRINSALNVEFPSTTSRLANRKLDGSARLI